MAVYHSTSRPRRGDAAILRAQSILSQRLQEPGAGLSSPGSVRDLLRLNLAVKPHEVFVALWLDANQRLIFPEEMFRGTLSQTAVHPREVVKSALHHNAAGVIFAHNHPGGVPEPSKADIELTRTLKTALRLVDVAVLDHFVVAGLATPVSFAERGLIEDDPAGGKATVAKAALADPQDPIKYDFTFSASGSLYSVSEKASKDDIHFQLTARLTQLRAMLMLTCGCGFKTFEGWSDRIKDDYLWACQMAACECEDLAKLI